jgi:hypothetical protein
MDRQMLAGAAHALYPSRGASVPRGNSSADMLPVGSVTDEHPGGYQIVTGRSPIRTDEVALVHGGDGCPTWVEADGTAHTNRPTTVSNPSFTKRILVTLLAPLHEIDGSCGSWFPAPKGRIARQEPLAVRAEAGESPRAETLVARPRDGYPVSR